MIVLYQFLILLLTVLMEMDPSSFSYAGSVVSSSNQVLLPSSTPQISQLSHRHLTEAILSQLTQSSILHLDFIHRSIEQLQQEIMSQ